MSDGLTVYCPFCGVLAALHKEKDFFNEMPVHTCLKCERTVVIYRVEKTNKGGLNVRGKVL